MNGESLISENVMSEDHLDAMFTILNELGDDIKDNEKIEVWVCEWDNVHGDMVFFR
jgi:hypothetical protein